MQAPFCDFVTKAAAISEKTKKRSPPAGGLRVVFGMGAAAVRQPRMVFKRKWRYSALSAPMARYRKVTI